MVPLHFLTTGRHTKDTVIQGILHLSQPRPTSPIKCWALACGWHWWPSHIWVYLAFLWSSVPPVCKGTAPIIITINHVRPELHLHTRHLLTLVSSSRLPTPPVTFSLFAPTGGFLFGSSCFPPLSPALSAKSNFTPLMSHGTSLFTSLPPS